MSDLPRVHPVPVETWTGPEEVRRTPTQRLKSGVVSVLMCAAGILTAIFFPSAVPWVLAVCGAAVVTLTVVASVHAVRARRSAQSAGRGATQR